MIELFKKNALFEQYYSKFLTQSIVNRSTNHKPVTAAYLFVLSDFALMSRGEFGKRNAIAQSIFAFLENKALSPAEMQLFDKTVDLFGEIVRGATRARGDWCFSDDNGNNPVYNLFLCYGDLIWAPHYLDNYTRAPILIIDPMKQLTFTTQFNHIYELTASYLNEI